MEEAARIEAVAFFVAVFDVSSRAAKYL